jgi:hypothetical protein
MGASPPVLGNLASLPVTGRLAPCRYRISKHVLRTCFEIPLDPCSGWAQAHRFLGISLVCRSPDVSLRAATVFHKTRSQNFFWKGKLRQLVSLPYRYITSTPSASKLCKLVEESRVFLASGTLRLNLTKRDVWPHDGGNEKSDAFLETFA